MKTSMPNSAGVIALGVSSLPARPSSVRRLGRSLAASALLGVASQAGALEEATPTEETREQGPAQTIPEADTALPTITVTASKRRSDVRALPASTDVFQTDELEETGITGLRDLVIRSPGVSMTELQQDQFRMSIRGIQLDSGGNVPPETGVFIDDIPFNDPFLNHARPDLALFDLESVEILKGPQGTLFGGSALAGAVRYNLADADPTHFALRSYAEVGDVEDGSANRSFGAAINMPMGGNTAALRLTAVRRLEGGTIDDQRNDVDDTNSLGTTSLRGILRWDVSDRFTARLKGLRQQTTADDVPFSESDDGDLERSRALRPGSPSLSRFTLLSLNLDAKTPWGDVTSVTSGIRKLGDLAVAYGERLFGAEASGDRISIPTVAQVKGLTQEVRLASALDPQSPWSWLVGAYAQHYDGETTQQIVVEPAGAPDGVQVELLDFKADIKARELALFGEVSRSLSARWRLTAGLRAYSIQTEGDVITAGVVLPPPGVDQNDADITKEGLSPKLALNFAISESLSTYLSVARGFRFGGIQITGPSTANPNVPKTYSPDKLWSYEWGWRSQWLDNRLQVDGALFYIDWDDPQVQTNTGGDVPLNVTDNVGGARSYGAELAVHYLPPFVKGLELDLAGGYTNAKTTQDFASPNGTVVEDGTRLPGYADVQLTASAAYRWAWGDFRHRVWVDHHIQGEGKAELEGPFEAFDYRTTDVRWSIQSRRWTGRPKLTLGATNLEDERAIVAATTIGPDNFTTIYNTPRTLSARLELEF